MKLDIKKWNAARIEVETDIKALKHSIRREDKPVMHWQQVQENPRKYHLVDTGKRYRGGTDTEYRCLASLKADATGLYAIRTEARAAVREGREPACAFGDYTLPGDPAATEVV